MASSVEKSDALKALHASVKMDFGTWDDELPEQELILVHVPPTATVLEIGSFIGRSTCILASVLDDDRRLVSLESNPSFARRLLHNRDQNGFHFHGVNAALSSKPMVQVARRTYEWDPKNPPAEIHRRIPTKTWPELQAEFPDLNFDHLVIDCEGAFLPIVKEWPSILDGIVKIIFENDFETDEQAEEMRKIFVDAGFSQVDVVNSAARNVRRSRKGDFHQVWARLS
jgi:FkbM family methyltransferase